MSRWWCNGCAIIKPGFMRLSFWNLKYGLFVVINLILTSYLVSIGNKNLRKRPRLRLGLLLGFYFLYWPRTQSILDTYYLTMAKCRNVVKITELVRMWCAALWEWVCPPEFFSKIINTLRTGLFNWANRVKPCSTSQSKRTIQIRK